MKHSIDILTNTHFTHFSSLILSYGFLFYHHLSFDENSKTSKKVCICRFTEVTPMDIYIGVCFMYVVAALVEMAIVGYRDKPRYSLPHVRSSRPPTPLTPNPSQPHPHMGERDPEAVRQYMPPEHPKSGGSQRQGVHAFTAFKYYQDFEFFEKLRLLSSDLISRAEQNNQGTA